MRRRDFMQGIAVFSAWPLTARAQRAAMPMIGLLGSATPSDWRLYVSAFHQGLRDAGYVEGQNVAIEARWANSQYERLPSMAAELVRPPGERDCCFLYAFGTCGKSGDDNNPYCLRAGGETTRTGARWHSAY